LNAEQTEAFSLSGSFTEVSGKMKATKKCQLQNSSEEQCYLPQTKKNNQY
jgi:hypothetical protein